MKRGRCEHVYLGVAIADTVESSSVKGLRIDLCARCLATWNTAPDAPGASTHKQRPAATLDDYYGRTRVAPRKRVR